MYSYSYLPLINKPTRITKKTATLIDNIFTNDLQLGMNTLNGILLSNIFDAKASINSFCMACETNLLYFFSNQRLIFESSNALYLNN